MKAQEFVKMDCHPITGFPLLEYVFTKKQRLSKRDYNRKKMREIAAKKETEGKTTL